MADSIYHAYTAMVNTAKTLLTAEGAKPIHKRIITNFDELFVANNK